VSCGEEGVVVKGEMAATFGGGVVVVDSVWEGGWMGEDRYLVFTRLLWIVVW